MNPTLSSAHPELLKEWDHSKNLLDPNKITSGSDKFAWWICPKGHSYSARINSRSKGTGCPYCLKRVHRKALLGYSSALDTHPTLLKEYDFHKNSVSLESVTANSHEKIWWICDKGHSYQQSLYSKIKGARCPFCTNRKVLPGFNDLATTHPHLIKEWFYPLNMLHPSEVTFGSNKLIWWICMFGHVWQAAVFSRTRKKPSGCPICTGHVKLKLNTDYLLD